METRSAGTGFDLIYNKILIRFDDHQSSFSSRFNNAPGCTVVCYMVAMNSTALLQINKKAKVFVEIIFQQSSMTKY